MKVRHIKWMLTRQRTDPRPNWHDGRSMARMQWYFPERGLMRAYQAYLRRGAKTLRWTRRSKRR